MMALKKKFPLALWAALAFACGLCLSACNSSGDKDQPDPNAPDAQAKKADSAKKKTASKSTGFWDAVDKSLDKSRVKDDTADMYRLKNDETVIFHKERRSKELLEKNETIDPSYYE